MTKLHSIKLDEKDLQEIRKQAEQLEIEDAKKQLRERALADERAKLRAAIDPSEEMRSITIELAEFADRITIDGRIYSHGQTYMVPKRLYDVLQECMFRTQQHEHEISGRSRNMFKPRLPVQLRPGHESLSASALNRAAGAI